MTTENTAAPSPGPSLDAKALLARINARIALLRGWMSHHHHDEPYWWARRTNAPATQHERESLRVIANILHAERASSRGRVHGRQFKNLDEQQQWLEQRLGWPLPDGRTLRELRTASMPV